MGMCEDFFLLQDVSQTNNLETMLLSMQDINKFSGSIFTEVLLPISVSERTRALCYRSAEFVSFLKLYQLLLISRLVCTFFAFIIGSFLLSYGELSLESIFIKYFKSRLGARKYSKCVKTGLQASTSGHCSRELKRNWEMGYWPAYGLPSVAL